MSQLELFKRKRMRPKPTTQTSLILEHMESGKKITPLDALIKYNCMRLAAIIYDLKNDYDIEIEDEWFTTESGKKVKRYWIGKDIEI